MMNERDMPALMSEIKKSLAKLESLIGRNLSPTSDIDMDLTTMIVSECTRKMQVYASYNHPLMDANPYSLK
jgi:hypothetical protein